MFKVLTLIVVYSKLRQVTSYCHEDASICKIVEFIREDETHIAVPLNIDCTRNVSDIQPYKFMTLIHWDGCHSNLPNLGLEYIDGPRNKIQLNITKFTEVGDANTSQFKNFINLQHLNFTNNSVIHGPIFQPLIKLKHLQIGLNGLKTFNVSELFGSSANSVKIKILQINEPQLVVTRDNLCAFRNLSQLHILSGDVITTTPLCESLKSLIYLKIGNISIGNDAQFCAGFAYGSLLSVIDVTHTNLTQFIINNSSMHRLKTLNLSSNSIREFKVTFSNLSSVEDLDLSYNDLRNLQDDQFVSFSNVLKINLSFNKIHVCEINSFQSNLKLDQLNLGHNFIQHLDIEVTNLTALKNIFVNDNNWNCNSLLKLNADNNKLFKLFRYDKIKGMSDLNVKGLKCDYETILTTSSTLPTDHNVESSNIFFFIIIATVIIILLIVTGSIILLAYRRYKKSKFVPFYRRLKRPSNRRETPTQSTRSFLFRRRLPATQYEMPINSMYDGGDSDGINADGSLANAPNNYYEEISSFTTMLEDETDGSVEVCDT